MIIILVLIILYVVFSFLSFIYIKRDVVLPEDRNIILVVLSASSDFLTISRLKEAWKLKSIYRKSKIAICGKEKYQLMRGFFQALGQKRLIVQNQSSNTQEDARYLKKLIPSNSILLLITNGSHQRRAFHSFRKELGGNIKIYNCPSADIFSAISPLLPTGWIAVAINLYKDFKYNQKIF